MKEVRFAFQQMIPLLVTYIFVGIACGILFHEAGLSVFWTAVAAIFIYAGSMQIILISLLNAGVPLFSLGIMTLFINGRHLFYGIGFIEKFKRIGGWKRVYLALTVTDETYSVLCSLECPKDLDETKVILYIQAGLHLIWITVCTVTALLGQALAVDLTGIDFTAIAFFTVVVVNQWLSFPSKIPALVGLMSGIAFWMILGPEQFILPALSAGVVALVLMRERVLRRMGGEQHE